MCHLQDGGNIILVLLFEWKHYFILHSFRKLNMFSFPYDWQDCALDFGNILKPAELVNISTAIAAVDLQSFYQSSEFIVDPRPVTRLEYEVRICFARISVTPMSLPKSLPDWNVRVLHLFQLSTKWLNQVGFSMKTQRMHGWHSFPDQMRCDCTARRWSI